MARPNPRLAAGVGLLTAFLAVAGPGAAVAIGHPGDRGDHRGDRGNNSERGGWGGRGDRGDDRGYGGHRPQHGNKPGSGKGEDRPGYGHRPGFERGDASDDDADGGTRPDDDSVAQDSGEVVPLEPGTSRVGAQRLAPSADSDTGASDDDDDGGVDTDTGSEVGTGGGASSGGGSSRAGDPAPAFSPPQVNVGNGRAPVVVERGGAPKSGGVSAPDPAPAAPAPVPRPAPPVQTSPPVSSVLSWTDLLVVAPVVPPQLSVAPTADSIDPLWGVAGLLLIPAAGAAVGYRQARAAQAAERLNPT